MTKVETVAEKYERLKADRASALDRARRNAAFTIPSLMPPAGFTDSSNLTVPWNSMPGRGVNRLAAKMTAALFPLNNIPFFEINLTGMDVIPTDAQEREAYNETKSQLDGVVNTCMDHLYASNLRSSLYNAFRHLQVCGNVVLFQNDSFNFQLFRLDQFVVNRGSDDQLLELIVVEFVNPDLLPEELQNINGGSTSPQYPHMGRRDLEPVYTELVWDEAEEVWKVRKEFRDYVFETAEYRISPYYVLRWEAISGENYGRGLVEENFSDIVALDMITEALIEGIGAASEGRILVNPSGQTDLRDLAESGNWSIRYGRMEDIGFAQPNNTFQLQVTQASKQQIEGTLASVFLMESVALPQGDRVTAEQIRRIASELEQALGGVFSASARDIQRPVVLRTLKVLSDKEMISGPVVDLINEQLLTLEIKTGLDALGREIEGARLIQAMQLFSQLQPEFAEVLDKREIALRILRSQGIDTNGMVYSPNELREMAQQKVNQQIQLASAQKTIDVVGDAVANNNV